MTYSFMLDTNMVTHIVKQQGNALNTFLAVGSQHVCMSVITYGEITFGLAKRPEAVALNKLMRLFLMRIDILPWTQDVADHYGPLRSRLEKQGKPVGDLDLLIAAHALHLGATLVTADKAFSMIDGLATENWLS